MFSFHTYLKHLLTLNLRLVSLELDTTNIECLLQLANLRAGSFTRYIYLSDTISSEFSSVNTTLSIEIHS